MASRHRFVRSPAVAAAALFVVGLAGSPVAAQASAGSSPGPGAPPPPTFLRHGSDAIELTPTGVPKAFHGALRSPVELSTARLAGALHCWVGLRWTRAGRRVSGVIAGDAGDYGGRVPATPRSFTSAPDRSTAVHTFDGVQVTLEHWWRDEADALVTSIQLRNGNADEVTDPIISVEWQLPGTTGATWPPEFGGELPTAPADVHRLGFMPNNLVPGGEQACGFAAVPAIDPATRGFNPLVPLMLWTNATWPDGVNMGLPIGGVSTGDVDGDGWSDVFLTYPGMLWRNVGGGDWEFFGDYEDEIGQGEGLYGCAIADLDDDGDADIGTEPRAWTTWCYDLLQNDGFGVFENIADDPAIIDVRPCDGDCETLGVADVDGDGDLDQFLPAYPDWVFGGPGNFFLQNLGKDPVTGVTTWHEASAEAGLDNPDDVNRPEGTTLVDTDGDGDTEIYCNGTLYRNLSTTGVPLFEPLFSAGTGIAFGDKLEEGAHFMDYDLDGDMDLLISFADAVRGLRMMESRGDGTFFLTTKAMFDAFDVSTNFGCSAADWDNDGDLDVTSTVKFRPNQWIGEGARHFTFEILDFTEGSLGLGTPAWFDFDHDGDLDTALMGWGGVWFLENALYDATTPSATKRHVRVRVVRDTDLLDAGFETEFGAVVSLDVHGLAEDGFARVQPVAASAGYLNQGEYELHFALPADPDLREDEDVHFALQVDFKGAREQGFLRVDRHVNPVLGDIDLAELEAAGTRQITVYRSGRVVMAGCDFRPAVAATPLAFNGELIAPGPTTPLPAPIATPAGEWYVGIEVTVDPTAPAQRVEELLIDGTLTAALDCGGTFANVAAWDVTDPGAPVLVPGGLVEGKTPARNHRATVPVDFTLAPGGTYRIVARVSKLRATPVVAPLTNGALTTTGGLSFQDLSPCDGVAVAAAALDGASLYLTARFRGQPRGAWADLGHGFAAQGSVPTLVGTGDLTLDSTLTLDLAGAPAGSPYFLVVGMSPWCLPFADGVLVPSVELVLSGTTDAQGAAIHSEQWPACLHGGESFFVQLLVVDPAAPRGFAFSNALSATQPY